MSTIVAIHALSKTYGGAKQQTLKNINLDIQKGEILALLGPNGAGKTTLISIICGIVSPTEGSVTVEGYDIISDYRKTRKSIGLVPQELTLGSFETVWNTVTLSRGLFGKGRNAPYIEQLLKELSLFDKKNAQIRTLSGGMKRRVLIAKALSHEPQILFLDEPTAGVDVTLRKDMWAIVKNLQKSGVTIILTTHYIEEAEAIADRVGIINKGELLLIKDKSQLMTECGKKQIILTLKQPLPISEIVSTYALELSEDRMEIAYTDNTHNKNTTTITGLLLALQNEGIELSDLDVKQHRLEDIFVELVKENK